MTETKDNTDEDNPYDKPLYIFGKDVRKIPCFRKSFLYGTGFAIGGGLLAFMYTSKAIYSIYVGCGCLWAGTLGVWFPCRYQYEKKLVFIEELEKKYQEGKEKTKLEEKAS